MPKLFENLWVKIAALILAILLWFHVVTNKIYQQEMTLPLTYIDVPGKLVLADAPPDSITVQISATGKRLLRSDWKRSGLRLLVNRSHSGQFKLELSKENLSLVKSEKTELLEVVSPREIELTFDKRAEKRVPIISRVYFFPMYCFAAIGNDSIDPAYVTVSGPESKISELRHIETMEKTIEGIKDNITTKLTVKNPNIYGLIIRPDTVSIFTQVIPVKVRTFSNLPIQLINAPSNEDYRIYPSQVELRLAGSSGVIENLKVSQIIVYVDYARVDSSGKIPIETKTPSSISVVSRSIDSVKLIKEE
jgi:YbbR domain-containing protein